MHLDRIERNPNNLTVSILDDSSRRTYGSRSPSPLTDPIHADQPKGPLCFRICAEVNRNLSCICAKIRAVAKKIFCCS